MKSFKVTKYHVNLLWILFLLLTVVTRFYNLANKPIHFDESINGWFVMQMESLGYYKYDPNNYHGPMYFYLLQFFEFLWGRSVETLRSVPATFSVLSITICTFPVLKNRRPLYFIAALLFLSPAFLFFGRSGIHEMPFVFFQIVFALGFLRWFESKDSKALSLVFVGLWGMLLLKETFVITGFCWMLALLSLGLPQFKAILAWKDLRVAWTRQVTVICVLLVILFALFYTGFFKNPSGLLDFAKAFVPWMKTGVHGKGHEKEFWYWLQVLFHAEPLVLLAAALSLVGVISRAKEIRVLSVFSLSQLLIYSLIPYKTVWCVISLIWGFYFVLGFYLNKALESHSLKRNLLFCVTAVLVLFGVRSAYNAVYARPLDFSHAYIYVNSTYELHDLQDFLLSHARANPQLFLQPVQIGMKEQWPWPWVLRSYANLSYDLCANKLAEQAAVYFCDLSDAELVETALTQPYWKIQLNLRQAREASLVYLRKEIFPETPFLHASEISGKKEE